MLINVTHRAFKEDHNALELSKTVNGSKNTSSCCYINIHTLSARDFFLRDETHLPCVQTHKEQLQALLQKKRK